jgi:site-specific recombinase XerD
MEKLHSDSVELLEVLSKTMIASNHSLRSVQAYSREVRFICQYYPNLSPYQWKDSHIIDYMAYLKTVHHVSYSKCKMVAQSVAFFFRHILKRPYDVPSKLYPKREYKLPHYLTKEEVMQLIQACYSPKQKAIVELFYSSGLRLDELRMLKMSDIDAKSNRIVVRCGKGKKDRYTLLSKRVIDTLRAYYRSEKVKPTVYLFEGKTVGVAMWSSSIQTSVRMAYKKAGLSHKEHKVHALRHSFATHLLDSGIDIHTIKELLGHCDIKTTMVYLHLQTSKRNLIVNPLDELYKEDNQIANIDKNTKLI